MPATLETVQLIQENKARDFEKNRRFEEMTDLAERIGFPIQTSIYYDLRGESLYARTDTKSRAFIEQTFEAREVAKYLFTGDQAFEQIRRAHEHQEAIDVERLAKGELDGNVMIKVSKVPDAVVAGQTSIKGYRRDTLRTFIRVYHQDDSSIRCKLFSIDQNNTLGLSQIGKLVGMQLTGRSSEDILADKVIIAVDEPELFVDELVKRSIKTYDEAIYTQTNKSTIAGSMFKSETDAQSAVEAQPYLLEEHFAAISSIVGLGLNPAAQEDLLEAERQQTAAAISLAARGHHVGSTGDSSVTAEVQNGNYSRECATTTENAMQQGEGDLLKDWERTIEMCPKCGATKIMAKKSGEIISGACGCHLNVCTGEYWTTKPKKAKLSTSHIRQRQETIPILDKDILVKRAYGETAVLRTQNILGGAHHHILDKKTGMVVDTLKDLRQLTI